MSAESPSEDFSGKTLKLNSPTGTTPLQIIWPLSREKEIYAARTKEFIDTISFVAEDFPDIRINVGIKRYLDRYHEDSNFTNAQKLVEKYNKVITSWVKINRGTEHFSGLSKRPCSPKLAEHILKQVYRMSVPDPAVLNRYQSFSSETYGETNFKQMETILKDLETKGKWKKNEVFVDLGSGIGSIVMQAAACCQHLKCAIGIEIQENPNKIAHTMMKKFEYLMGWYGKKYCPIDLYDGSFLDQSSKWRNVKNSKNDADFDWRREATVIFVNNYAFSENLNLKLKQAFGEMSEGTKIISTKAFCPVDFKINDRNAGNDIGSIMRVSEMASVRDGFSWTHNSVNVFLSEIDNTKLQEYYESKHQKAKIKSDRSSSSSPVPSSLDQLKHKKTLKTNAPMKKMSKGEIKIEPVLSDSEDYQGQRKPPVAVVNPTKNQHKPRKHKIKKESTLLNGQNKAAFDRFHHDQIKALNNNSGHVNGQLSYLDEIPAQAVDEAFEASIARCKKHFREAIEQVTKLPKDRFKMIKESEDRTIEKLKKLVREEEQAVKKLNRKAEQSYRAAIPYHNRKISMSNASTEAQIAKEEAQIAQLNCQIRRGSGGVGVHQNGHHHNHHSVVVKNNDKKDKNKIKTEQDPLPPRFAPPSPYSSIPLSPHSIKSSPNSSDAKVDIMDQVNYSLYNRIESSGTKQTRKPAEHFPINLTPQNGASVLQQETTTGSQRAHSNTNSLGSTSSSTNSTFDNQTSPRQQAKRTRIPSHESNGGVLIPGGGNGVVVADSVKQNAPQPSVIQHLHTTSPHLISTSQASQLNHNVIRNTTQTSLPPDTVVRYSGQKPHLYDHALYGGLHHGFQTTSQPTGASSSSSAYPSATQCPSQVQQLVKDNQTKTLNAAALNGIPQVPIVPGILPTGATPMSANELSMLQSQVNFGFPTYFIPSSVAAYGAAPPPHPTPSKIARYGAPGSSVTSNTHQTTTTMTAQTPPKKQKR